MNKRDMDRLHKHQQVTKEFRFNMAGSVADIISNLKAEMATNHINEANAYMYIDGGGSYYDYGGETCVKVSETRLETDAERDARVAAVLAHKEAIKERLEKQAEAQLKRERSQFQRLKKKFEGGAK